MYIFLCLQHIKLMYFCGIAKQIKNFILFILRMFLKRKISSCNLGEINTRQSIRKILQISIQSNFKE